MLITERLVIHISIRSQTLLTPGLLILFSNCFQTFWATFQLTFQTISVISVTTIELTIPKLHKFVTIYALNSFIIHTKKCS